MSKAPSAILSDALTVFNRAATLAFTTAQDQARKDVTQATTDAREARRERDEAVSTLHTHRLDEQAWKQEVGAWKARANKAELTIAHHLDTIAQLRQEATQWKNQCLRLEETARQEAVSWKEQFLRVEQERSKLAQRVEELMEEQLTSSSGHTQPSTAPYTPMSRYPAGSDLSASTRAFLRCSLSPGLQEHPPLKSLSHKSKTTTSAKRARTGQTLQLPTPLSENQRSARQRVAHDTALPVSQPESISTSARQTVLRRVHAVIEVPVKEESVDPDGLDTRISVSTSNVASTSTSAPKSASTFAPKTSKAPLPTSTTKLGKATTRVKRKAPAKRAYVEIDDEESERDDPSHDSKQSEPASEGDDELLMGVEVNQKDVYGMKHVSRPLSLQKTHHPAIVARKRKLPTATKKNCPSASSS